MECCFISTTYRCRFVFHAIYFASGSVVPALLTFSVGPGTSKASLTQSLDADVLEPNRVFIGDKFVSGMVDGAL